MSTMKKITAMFMFIVIMVLAPLGLAKEVSPEVSGYYGESACEIYTTKIDEMITNKELNGEKYTYLSTKVKENCKAIK